MYWCAAVSGGDGDLLAAMWKSSVNHVADIHEGHDPSYPRCLHYPNQESAWLQPGTVHITRSAIHGSILTELFLILSVRGE